MGIKSNNSPPRSTVSPRVLRPGLRRTSNEGALGLDHHQRDAVHEEHNVGDDVLVRLARGAGHLELVHGPERVVVGVVPVDEVDGAAPALLPALHRRVRALRLTPE